MGVRFINEDQAPTCPKCGGKVAAIDVEFGSADVPSDTLFRKTVSMSPRGDRLRVEPCGHRWHEEEVKPALAELRAQMPNPAP